MLPLELLTDGEAIWERIVAAVEAAHERLRRASRALERAQISYAVIGGNAVYAWVESHGGGGERNTPNVDLLASRVDTIRVTAILESVGFIPVPSQPDLFLDRSDGSPRTRVRLLFAEEKVREAELLANPAVSSSEQVCGLQVLTLTALVQVKLTAFRTIDRVHLRDMLDVGLIDETWKARYLPELVEPLQLLIDTPDG